MYPYSRSRIPVCITWYSVLVITCDDTIRMCLLLVTSICDYQAMFSHVYVSSCVSLVVYIEQGEVYLRPFSNVVTVSSIKGTSLYSLVGLCYTITWLAPGVPYTFTIACLTYRDHNYWSLQEFSNSYQSRSEVAPWHTQCLCFCCQANCIHVSNYIQMVQSKLRGIDMFVIIWSTLVKNLVRGYKIYITFVIKIDLFGDIWTK